MNSRRLMEFPAHSARAIAGMLAIATALAATLVLSPGALAAVGACDTGNNVDVEASGGTAQAGYATLAAAFTAINGGTHTGTIAVEVCADTSEPIATGAVLNASGAGLASYASISIKPVGGVARTVTALMNAGIPLIDLNGADNVTIDGVNAGGDTLTISNTSTAATALTSTIRFINGATSNVITNASIQGSFSGSATTNGGNIYFATDGTTANGNDNNTVSSCDIGPAGASLPTKGVYINGTTTNATINNSGIVINNNNIHDYFGATVTSAGIYVGGGATDCNITNNRFYQAATRTQTTGFQHSAIWIVNTTTGNNFLVSGNTIGFATSAGTGTYTFVGTTSSALVPIFLNVGTTTATSVQGNTIAGIAMSGTQAATSSSASFRGIYVAGGLTTVGDVTGNTIGSQSATGSITYTSSSTSASDVIGIFNFGSSSWTLNNNTVGGITAANSSTGAANIYGLRVFTASGVTFTCQNNTVGGTVANSIQSTSTATGTTVQGILNSSPISTITGNTIRNMTVAGGTGTTTTASMLGIVITATSIQTVSQNTISGLANTNATAATVVTGIQFNGGAANVVARNRIYGLTSATTSATAEVNGIRVAGGTTQFRNNMITLGAGIANSHGAAATNAGTTGINGILEALGTNQFFHNSVYIGGSPTAGLGASYAFNGVQTTVTRSFRDNIFVNARSNGGAATGKHYSIKLNGTVANPAGLTINNNNYFVSGTGTVFGFYNSLDVANLVPAWRTAVGQDLGSFESDPQYLDPTNATPDLHINPAITTVVEGNGADVGVTDDFDGQTRASLTPVDIGADAGNFTGIDLAGPVISYTPLVNTTSLTSRSLSATITDAGSGVPTAGIGLPVLYWKVNAGAYTAATGTHAGGSTYNFIFGGGVSVGDTVSYYIVAQDNAPTPNVSIFPSAGAGGLSSNPPAAATPPTTPSSYNIREAVSGTKTLCTSGCDYNSLTNTGGLFDKINTASILTGDTTVLISSNLTGETGTVGLLQWTEEGAGGYRLTIKPVDAPRTVTGTGTGGTVLPILGADRVTIDGSLTGLAPSRDLTFENTNAANGTGTVFIGSQGVGAGSTDVVIKNCIIKAGSIGTTATFTFGVFVGAASGAAAGADNDNFTFQNNLVLKARTGLQMVGVATTGINNNAMIVDNTFGDDVAASSIGRVGMTFSVADSATISGNTFKNIFLSADTSNTIGISVATLTGATTISQNTITNLRTTTTSSTPPIGLIASGSSGVTISQNTIDGVTSGFGGVGSQDPYGLVLGTGFINSTVTRNIITNIAYGGTGGYGGRGIDINTGTASSGLTISNNSISNIKGDGWNSFSSDSIAGIRITGTTGGINFYFNSVNLGSGTFAGNSSGTLSAAMYIGSTASALDIRNNVFATNLVNSVAAAAKTYAIYSDAAASAFTNIDYNDYSGSGSQGVLGFFASSVPTARATIADWRTSTGKDLASIDVDPLFTSATNLRPLVGSPLLAAGFPIGSVLIDLPGDTRSVTTPTIGAYEIPNSADLAVTKTDSPDPVATQGNITYTITVTNSGPLAAASATLAESTPADTTFVSITPPAGWTCPTTPSVGGTGAISCSTASLASGGSAVFTLVVKVDFCVGNTSTTNTATVSSTVPDPNMADNTAMETTTITDNNTCSDGNACTSGDACNGSGDGICYTTGGCDDANPCTDDACVLGVCQSTPIVCNTPPDACHQSTGTCTFPGPGVCEYPNEPNGTACNDTDPCTVSDQCTGGVCGGSPKDCDDSNFCTNDSCNPPDGVCLHANQPNGTSCDDGESCSVSDVCNGGTGENFDGVTAPALPAGWTAAVVPGSATAWATTTSQFDTAPNSAFAPDPAVNTVNDLVWGPVAISSSTAKLSFQKRYALEASSGSFYDGVVLEIKIGAGAYQDILTAGGSFVSGGYDPITISACCNNVLAGRAAWSGSSLTFTSTVVNLPASAAGQTISLRWRLGSDDTVGATGFWLDSVSIDDTSSCQGVAGNTGFVCRPAAGTCDDAEACNGTLPTCPADLVKPMGTVCLAGDMTGCNPDDVCDGTSVTCAPLIAPDGTSCTDSDICTTGDTCAGGACTASALITVSPNNLNGWFKWDDTTNTPTGTADFVTGPGTPPLGTGSGHFLLLPTVDRQNLMTRDYGSTRLDQFTNLRYSTYRASVDAGNNLAVSLQIETDFDVTDASTQFQGRLVFEPYQGNGGNIPQNTWQTWTPMTSGLWWMTSNSPRVNNAVVANQCPQNTPCTWAQVLAFYPNAGLPAADGTHLAGIFLRAGSTWPNFDGNVDALVIGVSGITKTYDFEPTDPCGDGTECTTDSCSNNACVNTPVAEFTACGDADNSVCNAPDSCNATGTCVDRKKAAATVCFPGDLSGCNPDDVCDGTTNACAPLVAPELSPCGDPDSTFCNAADSCDAGGSCIDRKKAANTVCLPGDASGCNPDDVCDGSTDACASVIAAELTACGDPDTTACNAADSCDAGGTCVNRVKPINAVCLPGDASGCNPDDLCDGTTSACAPVYAPEFTACGNSDNSVCNEPDSCNAAGSCVDRVKPVNTLCLPASGDCDVDDVCDGTNSLCPASYQPSTQECRPSAASCDPAEFCSGKAPTCPANTVNASAPVGDSVRVNHNKATLVSTILWNEPAPGPFNVYRGARLNGNPWSYNHGCYAQGLNTQSTTNTTTPASSQFYYFLVSRDDASCPESSLGPDSAGTDRPNATSCPNPGTDSDFDGVISALDNCPSIYNPSQSDVDMDGVGDACDNCVMAQNSSQSDLDNDSIGDACDSDIDGDGVVNGADNCPRTANASQLDADGDGVGDDCDNCPLVSNPGQEDTNKNGLGDACE